MRLCWILPLYFSISLARTYEEDWDYSIPFKNKTIIGEWGYKNTVPEQVEWAKRFVRWMKANGVKDTFFWTSVTNSYDTDGLWLKDCLTLETDKIALLQDLWSPINNRRLRINAPRS